MFSKILPLCSALVILALAACCPAPGSAGLVFVDAWVRVAPPGTRMQAAYGRLENRGNQVIHVDSWDSDAFKAVSLHRTVIEDGISRMVAQPALEMRGNQSVVLEPGALHLMLMAPTRELGPGDSIRIYAIEASGVRHGFEVKAESR